MENNVPYIVYESESARHERREKRLVLALIVAIVLIAVSNLAWLWFFNQFDFSSQTVMFDTEEGGDNSYIGNNGDIINGADDGNDNNGNAQEEAAE